MLYALLKIPARFAFWIYCRDLKVNKKEILQTNGPLLIASNHPNSFLDAVILATLFRRPVHSLARGDAFATNFYTKLLHALHILPVYRISEGVENLEHNYKTFGDCKNIFRKQGIVLIFSEGRCINEWNLRPLKKGTARLALSSWEDGIPLQVLPLGINYSSFRTFGKNLQLNFGEAITAAQIANDGPQGKSLRTFNDELQRQLQQLVVQVPDRDEQKIKAQFFIPQPAIKKILLGIPAAIGWLAHLPLYIPIKKFTWSKAAHNDHFDSVMMGLLFILYPFYLILISLPVYFITCGWWWASTFVVLPFCAWSYVQLKHQLDTNMHE